MMIYKHQAVLRRAIINHLTNLIYKIKMYATAITEFLLLMTMILICYYCNNYSKKSK